MHHKTDRQVAAMRELYRGREVTEAEDDAINQSE